MNFFTNPIVAYGIALLCAGYEITKSIIEKKEVAPERYIPFSSETYGAIDRAPSLDDMVLRCSLIKNGDMR